MKFLLVLVLLVALVAVIVVVSVGACLWVGSSFVVGQPDEWLLRIRNGVLVEAVDQD